MRCGLSYSEAHDLPWGELVDYMNMYKVIHGGAKLKKNEEGDFFKQLERI